MFFLTLVARDENLGAKSFQSLAEALPNNARYSDDNLNRAIDRYPKVHKFFSFLVMITVLEN